MAFRHAASRRAISNRDAGRETGAALLTVLLLVAILSVIAAIALERLTLASRMTRNIVSADQGRAYLIAAEQIAATRLEDLIARRADRTSLAGNWLGTKQAMSVPGGVVAAQVRDLDNCFNLNSLVTRPTQGVPAGAATPVPGIDPPAGVPVGKSADGALVARPEAIAQFSGLMRLLGVNRGTADQVAVSAADWIDSDSIPGNGGAEDDFYARFDPPYRAANGLVADPSELRMVNAVTPDLYQRIRPWVCALPETTLSPINVNTLLPGQAVLLAMLAPDKLGIDQARQVLAQRPLDGYGSLNAFWTIAPLPTLVLSELVQQQVQQKSRWFEVAFSADLGGDRVEETVLYDAGKMPVRLVRRQWGRDGD